MKRIATLLLALLLVLTAIPAFAEGGYEAADEDHTIRLLRNYSTANFVDDPAVQRIWDATGYHVVYDFLPAEEATAKLTLLLASGITDYDMVRVPDLAAYFEYASSGILLDITDRMFASTYYNEAFTEEERWVFDEILMDGALYALVSPRAQAADDGYFIRKDWLDALNLTAPTTPEELLEVLRAIKQNYPDARPFSISQDLYPGLIAAAYGVDVDNKIVDGKILSRLERADDMKAYLTYMNQLYNEGLLDNEFIVNTSAVVDEQVYNGLVGLWKWNVWGISTAAATFEQYQPDGEYLLLDVLNKDGYSELYASSGFNEFWSIPMSVADGADKVFDYLNKFYTEENYCAIYDGYEGVHYAIEDGNMVPIQPAFSEDCSNGSFIFGMGKTWNLKYWGIRLKKDMVMHDWYMEYQDRMGGILSADALDTATPIASRIEMGSELEAFANENITKFICNQRSIDEYDAFLAEWKTIGGESVMADVNAWYDTAK